MGSDGTTFHSEVVATKRNPAGVVTDYEVRSTVKTANFFGNDKGPVEKMKKLLQARRESESSEKA